VIKEIRGIGWFQVLPTGQKCSQPLQFNIIHILPEFKYPVEKLPIQAFIENKLAWKKKMEKAGKDVTTVAFDEKPTPRYMLEIEAFQKGMFLIDEFSFEHVCYSLSESQIGETGLHYSFSLCRDFLRLKTRPELGFTVMISNEWIFVGIITQPYC
jgi:hypothetical protein